MPRRPIDREAVLQAVDAGIMQLLAVKRMVEGLDDAETGPLEPWREPCPDREDGGAHVVEWFGEGPDATGMCRRCGAEFAVEPVGVSSPEGAEPRP